MGNTDHHHHIKLLRSGYKLHRGVIHDHRVELDACMTVLLLGYSLACIQEQAVAELHDVRFMDAGDFLQSQHQHSQIASPASCRRDDRTEALTLRLFLIAKSNANLAMRSDFVLVDTFKLSTTPGND